jgi:hypothetical protein
MKELFSSQVPDAPTPISSAGAPTQPYGNAAGEFNLKNKYGSRKVKSRKDSNQPTFSEDDATKRYFGDFSIEAKRHVWDLLQQHPQFGNKGPMRLNRVGNNTREVLPNDPTITQENGGYRITQQQPQASQTKYSNGTENH